MLRSKNIFQKLLNYFINRKIYIIAINRLYKIQSIFFMLRYLERKLDSLGFRIYDYRFVRKSKKLKEDIDMVAKHEGNLESYFNTSRDAKKIYRDLNKYIKL